MGQVVVVVDDDDDDDVLLCFPLTPMTTVVFPSLFCLCFLDSARGATASSWQSSSQIWVYSCRHLDDRTATRESVASRELFLPTPVFLVVGFECSCRYWVPVAGNASGANFETLRASHAGGRSALESVVSVPLARDVFASHAVRYAGYSRRTRTLSGWTAFQVFARYPEQSTPSRSRIG